MCIRDRYGAVLVVMAGLSLTFGALAGSACATASCGFKRHFTHPDNPDLGMITMALSLIHI